MLTPAKVLLEVATATVDDLSQLLGVSSAERAGGRGAGDTTTARSCSTSLTHTLRGRIRKLR